MTWKVDQTGPKNHQWKGGLYFIKGRKIIQAPECSRRFSNGYAQEHIVIAENAFGKPLPIHAVIHHVDGNKANNSPSNLVICQDDNYHRFIHKRMRAYEACGHADWVKCTVCKQYDLPDNLYIRPGDGIGYHLKCRNIRTNNNRAKRRLNHGA
ncbi:MAG: hypothetical protein A4E71_02916 [Smithella sp. PtaU1.Bin162]|nr:MAG: hypothetical protein A4E71_02916 [Smithella sp. PtaU1.Bin162]